MPAPLRSPPAHHVRRPPVLSHAPRFVARGVLMCRILPAMSNVDDAGNKKPAGTCALFGLAPILARLLSAGRLTKYFFTVRPLCVCAEINDAKQTRRSSSSGCRRAGRFSRRSRWARCFCWWACRSSSWEWRSSRRRAPSPSSKCSTTALGARAAAKSTAPARAPRAR